MTTIEDGGHDNEVDDEDDDRCRMDNLHDDDENDLRRLVDVDVHASF